jgi:hypothetical protein
LNGIIGAGQLVDDDLVRFQFEDRRLKTSRVTINLIPGQQTARAPPPALET